MVPVLSDAQMQYMPFRDSNCRVYVTRWPRDKSMRFEKQYNYEMLANALLCLEFTKLHTIVGLHSDQMLKLASLHRTWMERERHRDGHRKEKGRKRKMRKEKWKGGREEKNRKACISSPNVTIYNALQCDRRHNKGKAWMIRRKRVYCILEADCWHPDLLTHVWDEHDQEKRGVDTAVGVTKPRQRLQNAHIQQHYANPAQFHSGCSCNLKDLLYCSNDVKSFFIFLHGTFSAQFQHSFVIWQKPTPLLSNMK